VDEWTSAETGVGAAIAAGSHLEKGICALFVIAATRIIAVISMCVGSSHKWTIVQWPCLRQSAIVMRMRTSPIRFVRAVIMPAARDLGF